MKSNSEVLILDDYLICRECWEQQHYDPSIFKTDPGGIVYDREHKAPDWLFDQWHPWEKVCQSCLNFPCLIAKLFQVQTMDFFDRRQQLKQEFSDYYEKSLTKKYQPETPAQ